ncbi:LysE family translocator [Jiella marina]|uniref:LysE family translocator n=1 Tax=Jiella sp. LLJ827 TaxID=2917712 RepID=UPI00210128C6|nr:LysE family translocator [Jiella sp. LLJ827]MCQ0990439.1 LysE family translocator [Jiella sp. LLJ827]
MSWDFLLTAFIVVIAPGTGVVVTIAAGLSRGFRAALTAALGCTLGIVPHILAAMTGLAALLHASALAFEIIRYLGVAYLLYMAWMTLREAGPIRVEASPRQRSDRDVIVSAILVNVLNPKLSIFFFAFLPQFVAPDEAGAFAQMLQLSAAFMAMTFVVFALYGAFAASFRRKVLERPSVLAVLRRIFAAAFVGLGMKLALADR